MEKRSNESESDSEIFTAQDLWEDLRKHDKNILSLSQLLLICKSESTVYCEKSH